MRRISTKSFVSIAFLCLAAQFVPQAAAQPKPATEPSSTHIFPAGAGRGSVVQVRVGAECIPPRTNLWFNGDGITASAVLEKTIAPLDEPSPRRVPTQIPFTRPREWQAELKIADDAPLGPAYWRLSCASGGTGSRPFVIGDLPEFIETESNSAADRAEHVALPVTLNGQINGERDVDYYRFSASAGEVVVCEVLAARIGSRLDPVVEFLDELGQTIPVQKVFAGTDPVVAFRAPSNGEYLLRIFNISYHGDPAHVYRINLSTRPYVLFAFPPGGQRETASDVDFIALSGGQTFNVIRRRVEFPAAEGEFTFRDPETALSDVRFVVDDVRNFIEQEPNDTNTSPMEIPLPATVNGRISAQSNEDWFCFTAKRDETLSIGCESFPHGGSALPLLTLRDAEGNRIHQSRVFGKPGGFFWCAPADGRYLLCVADLRYSAQGRLEYAYRLSIHQARPDFSISLPSDNINVVQGADAEFDVSLTRLDGFDGAVDLRLEGLPDGVTVKKLQFAAGKEAGKIQVAAGDDAAAGSSTIRLVGRSMINGRQVERTAQARHLGVDGQSVSIGSATIPRLHLTVRYKPLFRLFCGEAYQYAHRGSVFPYPMEIERLEEFDGPIHLQQGDRQNRDMDGVEIHNATIAEGESKTTVPIYLPETMHINVQSQTQLYTQAYVTFLDRQNREQSMLFLSEKRNMLRTLPPVVKLKAVDNPIHTRPGAEIQCRFYLQRTSNFTGPMKLMLVNQPEATGFIAQSIEVAAQQSETATTIRISESLKPTIARLTFRASGKLYGNREVVTEAAVEIHVK